MTRKIISIELDIEEVMAKLQDLAIEKYDYKRELEDLQEELYQAQQELEELQEELYQAQQEEERIPGEPRELGDYSSIEKRIAGELRGVIKDIAQSPSAKKQG